MKNFLFSIYVKFTMWLFAFLLKISNKLARHLCVIQGLDPDLHPIDKLAQDLERELNYVHNEDFHPLFDFNKKKVDIDDENQINFIDDAKIRDLKFNIREKFNLPENFVDRLTDLSNISDGYEEVDMSLVEEDISFDEPIKGDNNKE